MTAYLPIIPWIGGKRRIANEILALLPPHKSYIEPFCGGAAILFKKEPANVEVINDINSELVNLYRVCQYHLDELLAQFKWQLISRDQFNWYNTSDTKLLTDIQRAARFFYVQKMAFGGKVTNQTFGLNKTSPPRLNLTRIEEYLSQAHFRLMRVCVENLPWQDCIKRYDTKDALFFCDPPYWQLEGYGVDFSFDKYELLAELAKSIKGKMIITVNDHSDIREVFKGMKRKIVPIKYSVSSKSKRYSTSKELIIRNW